MATMGVPVHTICISHYDMKCSWCGNHVHVEERFVLQETRLVSIVNGVLSYCGHAEWPPIPEVPFYPCHCNVCNGEEDFGMEMLVESQVFWTSVQPVVEFTHEYFSTVGVRPSGQ